MFSNNKNNLINDLSRKKSGNYNENVNNDLSQYLSNGFQNKKEELSETDKISYPKCRSHMLMKEEVISYVWKNIESDRFNYINRKF